MRPALLAGCLLALLLRASSATAQATALSSRDDAPPSIPVPTAPVPASPFSEKPKVVPVIAADTDAGTPEERCSHAADRTRQGILSETVGVDFKMYMSQMSAITRGNWLPLMPKVVEKPFYQTGEVVVCFAVLPNGQVEPHSMVLKQRSGDEAMDRAAWGAIETSVYPRLPEEFKGPRVVVQFCFAYNPERRPNPVKNLPKPPNLLGPVAVTLGYTTKF